MEGENRNDPFNSLIRNCQPTLSQEQKLSNCPFAGYHLSNPLHFSSSSSDSIPSHQTPILMLSVSDSDASVEQPLQHDDKEHHAHSNPSSSENQNLNALFAAIEREDRDKPFQVGISEGELHDDADPTTTRVLSEELDGGETVPVGETEEIARVLDVEETVPVGETEEIVSKSQGNEQGAEVVVVDSDGSVEEDTNLKPRMINKWFGKLAGFVGFFKHLAEGEQEESSAKRIPDIDDDDEAFRYVVVGDGEQMWVPLSSSLIEKVNQEKEKVVEENDTGNEMMIDEKMIEEEKYVEQNNSGNEKKKNPEQKNIGKKRKLPGSLFRDYDSLDCYSKYRKLPDSSTKGKEKLVEEEKGGMWEELLNAARPVDGDGDDVQDIIEIAKNKGMTFPRPRWWPSPGDKW